MEETTELIRITMPKSMASKFRERAKYDFHNCFWLMVKYDQLLASVFTNKLEVDIVLELKKIREELIILTNEMYEAKQ